LKRFSIGRYRFKSYISSPSMWLTIFCFFILYIPVIIIIIFSFNSNKSMVFPLGSFSLTWYQKLFINTDILGSLKNTFIVGISAVALSIIFGVSGAIALYRYTYKYYNLLLTIINFPLILPGIIVGLSLLIFFNYLGIRLSLITVIIAHMSFCIPTIFKTVLARLKLLPKNIIEASLDLYASNWRILFKVILPSVKTSIIIGSLLAFTLSFDETLITLLVTGIEQTLPMRIWAMIKRGFTPELNALATLMFVFSLIVAIIWGTRIRRSE
jgi:spermidine/putrescine transport system permease protein